jgi:hypothetical protein
VLDVYGRPWMAPRAGFVVNCKLLIPGEGGRAVSDVPPTIPHGHASAPLRMLPDCGMIAAPLAWCLTDPAPGGVQTAILSWYVVLERKTQNNLGLVVLRHRVGCADSTQLELNREKRLLRLHAHIREAIQGQLCL